VPDKKRLDNYPPSVENVQQLQKVTPFRKDDGIEILEQGDKVLSEHLKSATALTKRHVHACLTGPYYEGLQAFFAFCEFMDGRLDVILEGAHNDRHIVDHAIFRGDNYVWYRDIRDEDVRFAAMVVFKPGSLHREDFEPLMATSDEQEAEFAKRPPQAPRSSPRRVDVEAAKSV
jgi:hypothetical protein